jgi:hypothetical protein
MQLSAMAMAAFPEVGVVCAAEQLPWQGMRRSPLYNECDSVRAAIRREGGARSGWCMPSLQNDPKPSVRMSSAIAGSQLHG